MILEFQTEQSAHDFMLALDELASPETGYEVWDDVKESPEGTFYIYSPTGDPRFADWASRIAAEYTERELPEGWIENGDE